MNKGNNLFEYDQVTIICPSYNSDWTKEEDTEKYIIYNVSTIDWTLDMSLRRLDARDGSVVQLG